MGTGLAGADVALYAEHAQRVRALPLAGLWRKLCDKAEGVWMLGADDARDLVQNAMTALVKEGAGAWDPEVDPTARKFLVRHMAEARKRDRKRAARRRTELDTDAVEAAPPSSDRGAVRQLVESQEAAGLRDDFLARIGSHPLAVTVAELCMKDGELKPADIAERLGHDVRDIYRCQRRIAATVDAMLHPPKAAHPGWVEP